MNLEPLLHQPAPTCHRIELLVEGVRTNPSHFTAYKPAGCTHAAIARYSAWFRAGRRP